MMIFLFLWEHVWLIYRELAIECYCRWQLLSQIKIGKTLRDQQMKIVADEQILALCSWDVVWTYFGKVLEGWNNWNQWWFFFSCKNIFDLHRNCALLTIGHICARTLPYCAQNRSSLILKTDMAKSDKKVKAFQLFLRQALNDYIFS